MYTSTNGHVHGAFPIYEDVISRHPLLTRVLDWVQSVRSSLIALHVGANEMDPTLWRRAQREADEKVHLLRHVHVPGFAALNRR